jgi:hypothetical protein
MPLLFAECKEVVKGRLRDEYKVILEKVTEVYSERELGLWGEDILREFVEKCFVLAFYHDITEKGYRVILEELEDLGFNYNVKSFWHNTQCIKRQLAKWKKGTCVLGRKEEWEYAMRRVPGRQRFPDLCFWIDFTDFALTNKGGKKLKDLYWSYKCNSRRRRYMILRDGRRRYMILRDGRRRIRKMWEDYSPKVYDGHFLEMFQDWFEKRLGGVGVIGDQHFEWGKKLKRVKFYTAHHEPHFSHNNKPDEDNDVQDLSTLTQEQQSYNKALYKLRTRVELPFGEVKEMFKVLKGHWMERESQLDYLVWITVGILNSRW